MNFIQQGSHLRIFFLFKNQKDRAHSCYSILSKLVCSFIFFFLFRPQKPFAMFALPYTNACISYSCIIISLNGTINMKKKKEKKKKMKEKKSNSTNFLFLEHFFLCAVCSVKFSFDLNSVWGFQAKATITIEKQTHS